MVSTVDNCTSFYQRVKSFGEFQRNLVDPKHANFGGVLDHLQTRAIDLHASLFPITVTTSAGYKEDLHGNRSPEIFFTDTCEEQYSRLGSELNQVIESKSLQSPAWQGFSELLQTLDHIIQLRYKVGTDIKRKELPPEAKRFQEGRSMPIVKTMNILAETIKLWTSNLSATAKDFIEHHIHTNEELKQLNKLYSQKIPMFEHNFRTMFGFDHNNDGSVRKRGARAAKPQPTSRPAATPTAKVIEIDLEEKYATIAMPSGSEWVKIHPTLIHIRGNIATFLWIQPGTGKRINFKLPLPKDDLIAAK